MENIKIRKIKSEEVETALELALEVFMEFEAPDYGLDGVKTFKKDIIENEEYIKSAKKLESPIYAAFDGEKIVGLIGMRSSKMHINLVFTKKDYHRKGIATKIFRYLIEDILKEKPDLKEITLNSSPYGLPFYKHIGFVALSEEQLMNGIRYTPMIYKI